MSNVSNVSSVSSVCVCVAGDNGEEVAVCIMCDGVVARKGLGCPHISNLPPIPPRTLAEPLEVLLY